MVLEKDKAVCFVVTGVVKRIIPAVASTNAVIAGRLKEPECHSLLISPILYQLLIFSKVEVWNREPGGGLL